MSQHPTDPASNPTPPAAPAPQAPAHVGAYAPGAGVNLLDQAKYHVRRAFLWNIQRIPMSADEPPALAAGRIADPALQRYYAWRRSLLVFVTATLAVTAALATWSHFKTDHSALNGTGKLIAWLRLAAHWAMPAAAFMALKCWTDPVRSYRLLLQGWAIGFFIPIAAALVPLEQMVNAPEGGWAGQAGEQMRAMRIGLGLVMFATLLPLVLSLLPALVRASVRVKSLLPGSVIPGWFLMGAAALNVLIWLTVLVAINSLASNALLIAGVVLFVLAPMAFVRKGNLFIRPLAPGAEIDPIGPVQKQAVTMILCGVGCLVLFLFTEKIQGRAIVGTSDENSLIRLWDKELLKFVFEYLGRSLFMTALFAELLIRIDMINHAAQRHFRDDPAAKDYDAAIGSFEAIMPATLDPRAHK